MYEDYILLLALALMFFPIISILFLIKGPSIEATKEEQKYFKLNKNAEITNIVISFFTILYTLYLFFIKNIWQNKQEEIINFMLVYVIDSFSLLVLIIFIPLFLFIYKNFGKIISYLIIIFLLIILIISFFSQIKKIILDIISVDLGLLVILFYSIYIFFYNISLSCNGRYILATLNKITYSMYLIGAFIAFMFMIILFSGTNLGENGVGIALSIWFSAKIILSTANIIKGRNIFEENIVKYK